MAIAFVSVGTALSGNAGTTTVSMAHAGTWVPGNIMLAGRTVKPSTATATDEPGWTAATNVTGGTGTAALDLGTTRGKVDYRVIIPGDASPITFDQASTPDSVSGCLIQYSKNLWSFWEVVATTGDDTTSGTGRTGTGSAISLRAGDVIVAFVHSNTDLATAYTAPAITASGMTITTTMRLTQGGASQGNDSGLAIYDGFVTAGTLASVAPAISLTGGPTSSGATSFVRLREVLFPVTPTMATMVPS